MYLYVCVCMYVCMYVCMMYDGCIYDVCIMYIYVCMYVCSMYIVCVGIHGYMKGTCARLMSGCLHTGPTR